MGRVKELRELLAHHQDEAVVVMPTRRRSRFTSAVGLQSGRYEANEGVYGEFASDEDFTEDAAEGVPAVILWANG